MLTSYAYVFHVNLISLITVVTQWVCGRPSILPLESCFYSPSTVALQHPEACRVCSEVNPQRAPNHVWQSRVHHSRKKPRDYHAIGSSVQSVWVLWQVGTSLSVHGCTTPSSFWHIVHAHLNGKSNLFYPNNKLTKWIIRTNAEEMLTTSQLPWGSGICWEGNNIGLHNKIGPRQRPEEHLNHPLMFFNGAGDRWLSW